MECENTIRCLKEALDGETTASQKYSEYSDVARKEGFPNVAYLFEALSEAEQVHIKNHTNALKLEESEEYAPRVDEYEIGNTLENVRASIEGETWENKDMYPGFLEKTKSEKDKENVKVARLSMEWALKVEKTHAEVLSEALEALKKGKDLDIDQIYVCEVCGNLVFDLPEKICPVCKHDVSFYTKIERGA